MKAEFRAHKELVRMNAQTYGASIDITPEQALIDEVHRTAGHVAWLGQKVAEMTESDLSVQTFSGDTAAFYLAQYERERNHLLSCTRAAIGAGIAERRVALAEEQGRLLAMTIQQILHDNELNLDARQRSISNSVVARHLRALGTGPTESDIVEAEVVTDEP